MTLNELKKIEVNKNMKRKMRPSTQLQQGRMTTTTVDGKIREAHVVDKIQKRRKRNKK